MNLRCEISSGNEALQGEDPDAKKGNTLGFDIKGFFGTDGVKEAYQPNWSFGTKQWTEESLTFVKKNP